MRKQNRELTGKEKRQIKKLVVSLCANYDNFQEETAARHRAEAGRGTGKADVPDL